MKDTVIKNLIQKEQERQNKNIELIASENFVSQDILEAVGSILTNKYAEGYPRRRYYGGCEHIDDIEQIAIDRAKKLFGAEHANVQPHSGSQANMAVFRTVLSYGDTVLGMDLNSGGHLTHGHPLSFSGKDYNVIPYGLNPETEMLDYKEIERLAIIHQPKLIIAGASAYSRAIDFAEFRRIADEVGAYLLVDMAHIAGLVAAGYHQSPVPYADFVTSTTHKTLRGPRGGLILCKQRYAKDLDRNLFPGIQGGPLEHVIAGKAICFAEAMSFDFRNYIGQVVLNTKTLAESLQEEGFRIISGGTDNHLILVDLTTTCKYNGKEAQDLLDQHAITCNKNSIPNDLLPPMKSSGIRLGAAAMTTKGWVQKDFYEVGKLIASILKDE